MDFTADHSAGHPFFCPGYRESGSLARQKILSRLRENDPEKLQSLWNEADAVRRRNVGDAVHLRGLIELSNCCRRDCLYCGVRIGNRNPRRYRLEDGEVLEAARKAVAFGYGSLVIQSGEDPGLDGDRVTRLIRRIKETTPLAVTLSLGERSESDWEAWRQAGADRYLLRFESSNQRLFEAIHPPAAGPEAPTVPNRIVLLERLRRIGFEIGSGIMSGIPGQTWDDLADDLLLFAQLDLDMIGCGPFLPHPDTPLGAAFPPDPATGLYVPGPLTEEQRRFCAASGLPEPSPTEQVVSSETLAFKVIALARLLCPTANIPSTTAIATIDPKRGRMLGLSRGANVVMPNLTPTAYRALYEIYPNKAARFESAEQTHAQVIEHLAALGRPPGTGPGGRVRSEKPRGT
ncbi:MAG TPA: [FeFe] hydrogenase H-cluster radical SAM maturase HydE [Planctomycetaceae bacterium]|nr:[FeFe] hydrogenase H-cluster radical SAM maturase HydE [Planctomycetaceae bacterium]